jgi:hypothetical protein
MPRQKDIIQFNTRPIINLNSKTMINLNKKPIINVKVNNRLYYYQRKCIYKNNSKNIVSIIKFEIGKFIVEL